MVKEILKATIHELGRVGFNGLKYEAIAKLAGVNKTTIYRRWPTKVDLIRAAFTSLPGSESTRPNTGSKRNDLLEIGWRISRFLTSPEGSAVMQIILTELEDPELKSLCEEFGSERDKVVAGVLHEVG